MTTSSPVRGKHRFLDTFLANQRVNMGNKLIPAEARSGSVLDIGSGTYPLFLLNTEFAEKTGIDKLATPEQIADMQTKGISLITHDFITQAALPFEDNSFDVVTMLAVFEHIEINALHRLIGEVRRVLKPGGSYILTTPAGWTDPILQTLSTLKLVSPEEIDEHEDAYSHKRIMDVLAKAGFQPDQMKKGSFEFGMNLWVKATK